MFELKAYFWNDSVSVDGRVYRNNEILTDCLNLSAGRLEDWHAELRRLRQSAQLLEGGDETFCQGYNENVQRAQRLFYQIGNLAKKIPVYRALSNTLDAPLLFDCLNENFSRWEDGRELDTDDPRFRDEEFSNEYGFVTADEYGNRGFYVQRFLPDWRTLEDEDSDVVLSIRATNEAVRGLFDAYLTLLEDLLRARTAYAELLCGYVHAQRKYLNEAETANCFTDYLRATEKRGGAWARVESSGTLRLSHEVLRTKEDGDVLCETYRFDSLGAFLYVDFFRGLYRWRLPRRCDNCGRWFLLEGGKYASYCDRPLKNEPGKTCRDVGARKRYGDKCRTDPVWLVYNRAYKTHYARYMKKQMTVAEFERWSAWAVEIRTDAEDGKLALEEYRTRIRK
jgi:hypothetical protein